MDSRAGCRMEWKMLKLGAALLSLIAFGIGSAASAVTITFDALQHGEIVTSQFAGVRRSTSLIFMVGKQVNMSRRYSNGLI